MRVVTNQQSTCPHCEGLIVTDEKRGEAACNQCGTVVEDNAIDHGPEWTAYSSQEYADSARVGSPTSPTMHDKGLSTVIGASNTDAAGRQLSADKRSQMNRLRRWNERCQTRDAINRNLRQAFAEINRMASALGLPKSVRGTASVIYRRAVNENIVIGRSIEGVASAALYTAARIEQIPRTLEEITSVSRVKQIRIAKAYRRLNTELELAIEPADPKEYLPRFCSELDVSQELQRKAHDILDIVVGSTFTSGKHPAGLAAAAIYAAACLTGERITQEEISRVSDITPMTIRTHYRDLMEEAKSCA